VHLCVRGVGDGLESIGGVWVDPGAHPALRAAAEALAIARGVTLRAVPCEVGGAPRVGALRAEIEAGGGGLVAMSLVQHETGAIAPVRSIADEIRAARGVLVVDAVQALGKLPLDAPSSGATAMAFSSHKIGGAPGVGAAWLAADARIRVLSTGGGQERGLRAGTENVPGIVGFGAAAREVPARVRAMSSVQARRDRIEAELRSVAGVVVNGAERERVATACHVSMRDVAGEEIVAALDLEKICVSSGPACSSGRPGPSASMLALYPDESWRASSAVRITLGVETTDADVEAFVLAFRRVVARFR
jgi:cysteine desulfurase